MAISFTTGQYIVSDSLTDTDLGAVGSGNGGSVASLSCWVRLDSVPQVNASDNTMLWGPDGHPWQLSLVQNQTQRLALDFRNADNTGSGGQDVNGAIPGFAFHLAAVFGSGSKSLYINGYLVNTSSVTAPLVDPSPFPLFIGNRNYPDLGMSFTLDDLVYWLGYELTGTDVLNIRNRTSSPFDISSSDIVWGITCTGTSGQPVSLSDPGVTFTGTANANAAFTGLFGSPVYSDKLSYSPYTLYQNAEVGGSGQTIYFCFNDVTG